MYHDLPSSGHPGRDGTIKNISHRYFWPRMNTYITQYVSGCAQCQQNKINRHPIQTPYMPLYTQTQAIPFQRINMDFITDLPKSDTYDSLLVITDHDCTKATLLVPCHKTIDARQTADLLLKHVYAPYGLPQIIISDRGTQFAAQTFQNLCQTLGIKSTMSTAYHPQTDGQAERTNQEIETYFRIYCYNQPHNWAKHIPILQFEINNKYHSVTNKKPSELLLGYTPRAIPDHFPLSNFPSIQGRLAELLEIRKEAHHAHDISRQRMGERNAHAYPPFKVGERVWLHANNLRRVTHGKFSPTYEGPFTIAEQISPLAFRLNLPPGWRIHNVFHAMLLSKFTHTNEHGTAFTQPPPDIIQGTEEFEVESILNHRYDKKQKKDLFLIKWKGYSSSENSWEPETHLQHTKRLLDMYKSRNGLSLRISSTQ